ncbi:hypothetical protein, partial [Rhodopseudomonas palustris]
MTISVTEAIEQNTKGMSDGLPVGVPASYSWYTGAVSDSDIPPADFSSVGGWGQIYPEQGSSYSNPNATVEVANAQTWVHLSTTNQWVLVQSQANDPLEGGHFVADFAGNAGIGMEVTQGADGTATMEVPPLGYNDHFWHVGRGQFAPGTVDGVYVQMDMKISDPNVKAVANIGADWWRTPTADYVDGFGNNPGAGMSNWVELTGDYQTLAFYSGTAAEFRADPPPCCTDAIITNPNPPVTDPPGGIGTDTPIVIPPGSTPDPVVGVNLLKNGSFEATPVGSGQAGIQTQINGWTALSGSAIELWNNLGGVQATEGNNFVELDYMGAQDGFSQSVQTSSGQALTLSVDARTRPGENPYSCGVEVLWNGEVISTIQPGADWSTYSVNVTGTGGNDTLTIREPQNQAFDGVGAMLDNLKLAANTASTPTDDTDLPSTDPTPGGSGTD